MTVKKILDGKGRDVVTLSPEDTIDTAVATLAKHKIGALVVTAASRIESRLTIRECTTCPRNEGQP